MITNLSDNFDFGFVTRGIYKNHPTTPGIYTSRGVLPRPFAWGYRSGFCSLVDTGYTPPARDTDAASVDAADGIAWDKPYLTGAFPNFYLGLAPGGWIYIAGDGSRWFVYPLLRRNVDNSSGVNFIVEGVASVELRFYKFGTMGVSASVVQTARAHTAHQEVYFDGVSGNLGSREEFDFTPSGSKAIVNHRNYLAVAGATGTSIESSPVSLALRGSLLIEIAGVPPAATATLTSLAHDGTEGDLKDINGGATRTLSTESELFINVDGAEIAELTARYETYSTTNTGVIYGCFFDPLGAVAYIGARISRSATWNRVIDMVTEETDPGDWPHRYLSSTQSGSSSFEFELYMGGTVVSLLTGSALMSVGTEVRNIDFTGPYRLSQWTLIGDPGQAIWTFDGETVSYPYAIDVPIGDVWNNPGSWYDLVNPAPVNGWANTTYSVHHVSNNMLLFTRYELTNEALGATLLTYGTPTNITHSNNYMGTDQNQFIKHGSRNPETGEIIVAPYPVCYV